MTTTSQPFLMIPSLVLIVLSVLLHLLIRPWWRRRKHFIDACEELPGPALGPLHPHPWLADVGTILSQPPVPSHRHVPNVIPLWMDLCRQYKHHGLLRLWAFNPYRIPFLARPIILVFDPDMIKQIVGQQSFGLYGKGHETTIFHPLFGRSLLSLPDGSEWKHQRKLIAPAFGHAVMERATQSAIRRLKKEVFPQWDATMTDNNNNNTSNNDNGINVVQTMSKLIISVLGDVAFSYSFYEGKVTNETNNDIEEEQEQESLHDLFTIITQTLSFRMRVPIARFFPTRQNWRFFWAMTKLNKRVNGIISKRYEEMNSNGNANEAKPTSGQEKDLLSQLLMTDKDGTMHLSRKCIFDNVRTFLFAGHETTANAASYALWHLAKHQHVQTRLCKEIDALFERINNGGTEEGRERVTYTDLRKLKVLNAVIKETLRLTPPAGGTREANQDIMITKGDAQYLIPKGANLVFASWFMHRLFIYWEDPDEFQPERFLVNERSETQGGKKEELPHPYMPFSLGPRSCIGQELALAELRAIIAWIVHCYTWEPAPNAKEPVPMLTLTISPHEVYIRLKPRG